MSIIDVSGAVMDGCTRVGGVPVYGEAFKWHCAVCGAGGHLGGWSGFCDVAPMSLARHVLPCPVCGHEEVTR